MSRRARLRENARPWKNGENTGGVDVESMLAAAKDALRHAGIDPKRARIRKVEVCTVTEQPSRPATKGKP